jgi:hypothetical protein
MATNALAPKSKNAMVRQLDPLQSLLQETAAYPQYGALAGYLSSRQMMPPIEQKYGAGGKFEKNTVFGSDLPKTGAITVGYEAGPSTLVHELTHAADNQISSQYYELKNKPGDLTPAERQFMQAFEKLVYRPGRMFGAPPESTRSLTAQRIAPEWSREKSDYRSTGGELAAFGMGSSVSPNVNYRAPAHIDPSYATEFSILLDMASKLQKSRPLTDKR